MRAIDVVVTGRFPYLSRFAYESPQDLAVAEQSLARCDVLEMRDRHLDEMSGGERRRVFLARVLAGEPQFLLLDEPLSALDAGHAQDLLKLLRGIVADGQAVAYVTHDVNSALAAADRVLVLDRGRVIGSGVPHEVLTPPFVEQWFGLRCESVETAAGRHWIVPL
jgi:iron complex transport system ATP-binding protein